MTDDRALTEAQAAERLAVSAATLRNWRQRGVGPAYRRFGRAIRYLDSDLMAYMAATGSGPAPAASKTR